MLPKTKPCLHLHLGHQLPWFLRMKNIIQGLAYDKGSIPVC